MSGMNEITQSGPRAAFRLLRTIASAIIGGMVLFALITFYLNEGKYTFKTDLSDILVLSAILLTLIAIPSGFYLSGKFLTKIDQGANLKDRILKYQTVMLVRLATCEGSGLFAVVCLLLSANLVYAFLIAIALLVMAFHFPTVKKLQSDLNFTDTDVNELC